MNTEQQDQEFFDRITLELNGVNADCLVPKQETDWNWQRLRAERSQPIEQVKQVRRIVNCRFRVWHDSDHQRLSAEYDVIYCDRSVEHRRLNGKFDNTEAHVSDLHHALDCVRTLINRSGFSAKIRTARLHVPGNVLEQSREINVIEVYTQEPMAAWFVYNGHVYPARLDQTQPTYYAWVLNGRKFKTLKQFDNECWIRGSKK